MFVPVYVCTRRHLLVIFAMDLTLSRSGHHLWPYGIRPDGGFYTRAIRVYRLVFPFGLGLLSRNYVIQPYYPPPRCLFVVCVRGLEALRLRGLEARRLRVLEVQRFGSSEAQSLRDCEAQSLRG